MENSFVEKLLNFLSGNKQKNNISVSKVANTEFDLHNKNVVYPNDSEQRELDNLFGEIRSMQAAYEQTKIRQNDYVSKEHMISDAYKKFTVNKNINRNVNKSDVKSKETTFVRKTATPHITDKQRYREMENNLDNLLSGGKNLFKNDDLSN